MSHVLLGTCEINGELCIAKTRHQGDLAGSVRHFIDLSAHIISTHDERTKVQKAKDFASEVKARGFKGNVE